VIRLSRNSHDCTVEINCCCSSVHGGPIFEKTGAIEDERGNGYVLCGRCIIDGRGVRDDGIVVLEILRKDRFHRCGIGSVPPLVDSHKIWFDVAT
jgi:hypothetical protein